MSLFSFYRRVKNSTEPLASPAIQPEARLEPFEPVRDCDDPSHDASSFIKSSCDKMGSSQNLNSSPATSSALLSSLSSPVKVGISEDDVCLRGSPQIFGGVRGGMVGGTRPSSATRLSLIDRKWLDRCQVFGEMEAEVKPGAGNQENNLHRRVIKDKRVGNEEKDTEGRRDTGELGIDKGIPTAKNTGIQTPKPSEFHMQENVNNRGDMVKTGVMPSSKTEDGNELTNKSKDTKKRGRKRQREGEMSVEGAVKKRQRKAKNEESSDVHLSPLQAGGKKGRTKKKEDGETKEERDTKLPQKVTLYSCQPDVFNVKITSIHHSCPGSEGELVRRSRGGICNQANVSLSACWSKVQYKHMSLKKKRFSFEAFTNKYFPYRNVKCAEGNFVKINLKKKSHVKGYALRGVGLRKQVSSIRVFGLLWFRWISYVPATPVFFIRVRLCKFIVLFRCTCRSSS